MGRARQVSRSHSNIKTRFLGHAANRDVNRRDSLSLSLRDYRAALSGRVDGKLRASSILAMTDLVIAGQVLLIPGICVCSSKYLARSDFELFGLRGERYAAEKDNEKPPEPELSGIRRSPRKISRESPGSNELSQRKNIVETRATARDTHCRLFHCGVGRNLKDPPRA